MLFIFYPKCSTCKELMKFLTDHGQQLQLRDIVLDNPTANELKTWHELKGGDIKKFINTSGLKYKELNLKDKLPTMTNDDVYDLLATDGMLVRRPLLITDDNVFIRREIEEIQF